MIERLQEALNRAAADFAEIRVERRQSLAAATANGAVTRVRRQRSLGGVVRCLVQGAWGVSSFEDLADLDGSMKRAVDAARAAARSIQPEDRVKLAPVEPVQVQVMPELIEDFREVPLEEKLDTLRIAGDRLRAADPGIARTRCLYEDRMREIWMANTEGTALSTARPLVNLRLVAQTPCDGLNLRAYEAISLPRGFEICRDRRDMVETLAERTRALRDSIAPPSARLPVVMDYAMAGLFAHEAFGHLCEADNIHRDPHLRAVMTRGRRFGSEVISIGDDGTLPGLRASQPYDEEGVPTSRVPLLERGVLVGEMHSRETAGRLGRAPTGNGRALSYKHTPIVRMSNTYIEPGDASFDELIADVKLGLYACGHMGGSTTKEQFVFNGAYGYMIRDGRLAEMVRNVTLTGNVFQTLADIDAVGRDQQWHELGFCGKDGQNGHLTTKGCPPIRVRELVIGGRA